MSDTLTLTRNQKKAITTLNRSVLVTADAGCGETELLAQRFCYLVECGKAGVDEILAVTLTTKSAEELKECIASRLAALGRAHGRRTLDSAHIGTIHGFCSQALRENSFEAGVDPRFSILGDVRQRVMVNQVLDEIIGARQNAPAMMRLLQELDLDAIREAVFAIYRHVRTSGREPSAELISPANDPAPFLQTFERCYQELMTLEESADEFVAKMMDHTKSELAKALRWAGRLVSDGPEFDWRAFQGLKRYRGRFRPSQGVAEVDQVVKSARDALSDFLAACLDRQSSRCAGALLDLAADFDDRYTSAKAQLGLLDYDDLLGKAEDLFWRNGDQPTEVACRYRDRFKFVMLSDFQEASGLQRQVLDAVCRPDSMFAVGDPKQSIFGFMHGDAETPYEHCGERRPLSIHLHENLASRRGIIGFVNYFFGRLWSEDPDVEYDELKCAGKFASQAESDVEIILVPTSYKGSVAERNIRRRQNEARVIAQRILEITGRDGNDPLLHAKVGRVGQPITLGDIVVLLRWTGDMQIYERALEERGIDACAVSGRGFYGTREVRDVISLLRVVDDPLDDIAMAEVLLSPFAGVSEDALLSLCSNSSADAPGKLWESMAGLDDAPHLEESDRSKLSAFHAMVRDLLDVRSQMGVTDILDLALERSRFDMRLLAMPGGRRRYANVQKFCGIAREFEASGQFGLADFVAHSRELERLAEREAEAATEREESDAVRIMTIHRAKGLQWPVVIVADTSRNLEPNPGLFAFDHDRGLAVRVSNPLTERFEVPLCHREVGECRRRRALSEEKRLLYVAMTRAEEHLILVGYSDLKGSHRSTYRETGSWSGWLEKALELGPGTPQGVLDAGGCRVRFTWGPPPRVKKSSLPECATLADRYAREFLEGRPIEDPEITPGRLPTVSNIVDRCLIIEPPVARRVSRLSVSQVLDYLECPARYRLLHIIGMPEEGGGPVEEAEEPGFAPADLGHLVHDLLAGIDFSKGIEQQLRVLISEVTDERLRAQAGPLVEGFLRSRWCDELRSSPRMLKETPFEFMAAGKVLAGRMDVLYQGKDGWTILDYKTGRAETRKRYELQVGVYAHATSRLLGEMPTRTALLVLSADEEWVQDTSDGAAARMAADKVSEVAAAIEADKFKPSPGKQCEWCNLCVCRRLSKGLA